MAELRGRYVWKDDSLVPGHSRDGGLHQNLYDSEGRLQGNAHFVPDVDETGGDELLQEAAALALSLALPLALSGAVRGVFWLRRSAVPAIDRLRDRHLRRDHERSIPGSSHRDGDHQLAASQGTAPAPGQDSTPAPAGHARSTSDVLTAAVLQPIQEIQPAPTSPAATSQHRG